MAVKRQTHDTAQLYGLDDRGVLEPGKKADLNLIDFDHLALRAPEIVFDFPAGGKRFVQRAMGYKYTIVSGEVISRTARQPVRCRARWCAAAAQRRLVKLCKTMAHSPRTGLPYLRGMVAGRDRCHRPGAIRRRAGVSRAQQSVAAE